MIYILEVYMSNHKPPMVFHYRNMAKLNADRQIWREAQVPTRVIR